MTIESREYQLVRRPVGMPTAADFRLATATLPPVGPGQIRVRNQFLSVDPYMRSRMSEMKSYAPAFELDQAMSGGAVGRVEESQHPKFAVGDVVLSMLGWREGFVSDGQGISKLDVSAVPPQAYLGTLGMPGLTAYAGLLHVGALKDGETVLVSGAAGAVGMVVCQIAKAKGCRVIGVVGSDEKGAWLQANCGVDAIVNYKTAPSLRKAIFAAAPDGVDVTFENVGGEHLDIAAQVSKPFGRIAVCGLISQYNATEMPEGFKAMRDVLVKRLTLRGFIVTDHVKLQPEFVRDMTGWLQAGKLKWTETIVDGFEKMPDAFFGLFAGANTGKMVVRL
jgi:NADPH-dependent curcumin reductase CurA